MTMISQTAIDFVVDEEVSSQSYYEKHYRGAEWPGGHSGITLMIGYDIGQSSAAAARAKLHADLDNKIPIGMIGALEPCCGVAGDAAREFLPQLAGRVDIPFATAMQVFTLRDVPTWTALLDRVLPNYSMLSPDCAGALFSIAYNRGASFDSPGDRYAEMRAIKAHMEAKEFAKIPAEIRSMKRLWNNGLVGRREREAQLFERGLHVSTPTNPVPPPPPSRNKDAIKKGGHTIGTIAVGTGAATGATKQGGSNHGPEVLLIGLALAAIIGLIVYFAASRHTLLGKGDPPTTGKPQ